jgi:nucleoside-diphosphate-sugar epimerase
MYTIIGGSGFVGSRLISLLGEENCTNLDKNSSPFFKNITTIGDIRNQNQIEIPKNTTSLVLLAAEHRDDVSPSSLYYDVNVNGTKNVLKKMDELGIKNLIFTSSVAIYGLNKINPNEDHIKDPFNHYGKSKWKAELAIKDWYYKNPNNKSVTIIRPTVIFGERNRGNVYNLLNQIVTGNFMMIGKGENMKSMAYVGNIVYLINHCLKNNKSGFHRYNYADKPDFTMLKLTNLIEYKMNIKISKFHIPYLLGLSVGYFFDLISLISRKKFPISSVRVIKFCSTTQFNSGKVLSEFTPHYSLEEGLSRTLDYEFLNPKKDDVLFYSE